MANQHTTRGRTVKFQLRLTTDEKRALDARAGAEGLTLADLIRGALGLAEAPEQPFEFAARVCRHCGQLVAGDGGPDGPHRVVHKTCNATAGGQTRRK